MNYFWDPSLGSINQDAYNQACLELNKYYEKLQQSPQHPIKKNIIIFFSLLLGLFILSVITKIFIVHIFILLIIVFAFYVETVRQRQKDIVRYFVCRKNNWLYNPENSPQHGLNLVQKFPEIIEYGGYSPRTENEIWGNLLIDQQPLHFYTAKFIFFTGGQKNQIEKQKTILAIKLDKKINIPLYIKPEETFIWSRKNDISTESREFNRNFSIFYKGQKQENQQEIIEILSPAIQLSLLEFKKEFKNFHFLLREDTAIFIFKKTFLNLKYTNFFKKIAVDPRDEAEFDNLIKKLAVFSKKIVQYLD